MATQHHTHAGEPGPDFLDQTYSLLTGLVGVGRQLFLEIHEPDPEDARARRKKQDMSAAMDAMLDQLECALGRDPSSAVRCTAPAASLPANVSPLRVSRETSDADRSELRKLLYGIAAVGDVLSTASHDASSMTDATLLHLGARLYDDAMRAAELADVG